MLSKSNEVRRGFLASPAQNSGFFVFDSLRLGPSLFLDNSLLSNMLGVSQVWPQTSPGAIPWGSPKPSGSTVTPCPQMSGFQKVACPFCKSNTWNEIANYRHQILSPRRSENASNSLLRSFIFIEKPLPNIGHISLCLTHAFYLFSTRQTHNASFAGWSGIHLQGCLYIKHVKLKS